MKHTLDQLISLFGAKLTENQIAAIFELATYNFDNIECLLSGPDLPNTLKLMFTTSKNYPIIKISIDEEVFWADLVGFYKGNVNLDNCQL